MNSKTKIVVLHMKEIIYTVIFAVLTVLLIFFLIFMFGSGHKKDASKSASYVPGVYTSGITLNNMELEVEVTVDKNKINSIRFVNLSEAVTTMFPLIQPTIEEIAEQICEKQSLEDISCSEDNPYTSRIILDAIETALKKATAS